MNWKLCQALCTATRSEQCFASRLSPPVRELSTQLTECESEKLRRAGGKGSRAAACLPIAPARECEPPDTCQHLGTAITPGCLPGSWKEKQPASLPMSRLQNVYSPLQPEHGRKGSLPVPCKPVDRHQNMT